MNENLKERNMAIYCMHWSQFTYKLTEASNIEDIQKTN